MGTNDNNTDHNGDHNNNHHHGYTLPPPPLLPPPPPLQQRRPGSISETSITRTRKRRRSPRWRPCRKRRKLRIPWRLLLLRNPKLNQKFLLMLKSRFKPSI